MPKASKGKKFYAVHTGRQTGVFLTWEDCEKQTKGFPGAKYQSFMNAADAEAFVSGTSSSDPGSSTHPTSGPSGYVTSNAKGKKRAISKNVADEFQHDIVYCDGACKGNGQAGSIAGVGVWWEENDPRNIAERCPGDQTNNRAELIAIVRMLETTPASKKTLLIRTDSQYCIKCFFQWLPKWKRNNFRTAGGNPVKNVEIIKYASTLLEVRALVGQPVRMEYVKGHSGDRGNDGADAQANKGALLPPVPERDWTKAKQELLKRLEEERRLTEDQPISALLGVDVGVLEQSTNQPHKARKISHDQPFSRLSSAPASMEQHNLAPLSTEPSTGQVRSRSLPHIASSSPPLPVVRISSSQPQDPRPSQAHPPLLLCNTDPVQPELVEMVSPVDFQPSTGESSNLSKTRKTPVRKHGVGLFTTTPPPNAEFVMKFSTLPWSQKAEEPESSPQAEEKPVKPTEEPMEVNVDGTGADLSVVHSTKFLSKVNTTMESQKLQELESGSVPQDQGKVEKLMVTSVDVVDVDLKKEVQESGSVLQDQEEFDKPMAMSTDAADVDLNDAEELEPTSKEQKETVKPMAMSVDAADVDLNDYLDCVDDDPFDDV